MRGKLLKLAKLMDTAEEDVLAYITFPAQHRIKLHSTDEIDKGLLRELLFFAGAVDLVAKRGASAGSVTGQPFQSLPIWGSHTPGGHPGACADYDFCS